MSSILNLTKCVELKIYLPIIRILADNPEVQKYLLVNGEKFSWEALEELEKDA